MTKVEAKDEFEVKKEAILVNDTLNAEEQVYDPRNRDSKYARVERSSLWEAITLAAHYHPSVSMFATSLCSDLRRSTVNGDPLRDYSMITFLDRFCFKRSKNRIKKSLSYRRICMTPSTHALQQNLGPLLRCHRRRIEAD